MNRHANIERKETGNTFRISLEDTEPNRKAVEAFHRAKDAVAGGNIRLALQHLPAQIIDQIIRFSQGNSDAILLLSQTGDMLSRARSFGCAERIYRTILDMKDDIPAYSKLMYILKETGRLSEAEALARKTHALFPKRLDLAINLASILLQRGKTPECQELIKQALCTNLEDPQVLSSCLLMMHYFGTVNRKDLFEAHTKLAQSYPASKIPKNQFPNTVKPDRKFRIGYISPDFRGHPVTCFFMPLLDAHNRDAFEIVGYGNVKSPDKLTEQIKPLFSEYRDIYGSDTEAVCTLIQRDAIDILVDLAGHTSDNLIPVLARKPAPIQVTYLGYPNTTGLPQVDYRLTDRYAEAEDADRYYSEKLVYLDTGFLCYCPPTPCPEVAPLPATKNGFITFGSFNMNKKVNAFTIGLWADVMKRCENSKLMLKFRAASDPEVKKHYVDAFQKVGIPADRIDIVGWLPQKEHFDLYGQVDIALDTYPYHGTTTTCEALLMGVPVISLVGDTHMSRVGLSISTRLGLEFLTASTPSEYVSKAYALAAQPQSLEKLRASMRARMTGSHFCDGSLFVKHVEQVYREMWQNWCKS